MRAVGGLHSAQRAAAGGAAHPPAPATAALAAIQPRGVQGGNNNDSYTTTNHPGQVSGSAAPALSLHQRPVWLLEEMQSNALFSRQRRQLGAEEEEARRPLRSISGDTRVTRVAVTRAAVTRVAVTRVP